MTFIVDVTTDVPINEVVANGRITIVVVHDHPSKPIPVPAALDHPGLGRLSCSKKSKNARLSRMHQQAAKIYNEEASKRI